MVGLVQQRLDRIADVCRTFGVSRLWVFGSALSDRFDPSRSDVDFLVEESDTPRDYVRHFFPFEQELAAVVGRPVDVVEPRAVRNPFFRASFEKSKVLIYEK